MATRLACSAFTTVEDVLADEAACDFGDESTEYVQGAIDAASDILYVLTGGTFTGRCSATVRPVRKSLGCWPSTRSEAEAGPTTWSDYYGQDVIPLRDDLISVDGVHIDGVQISPSEYMLHDGRFLARRDGRSWPSTNILYLALTEEDTFGLDLVFGTEPDWLAAGAATEIAVLLMKDDRTGGRGYLRGITSASVQGAQVRIDQAAAGAAKAGMALTDRLVGLWGGAQAWPSGVWSPNFEAEWQLVETSGPSGS